MASFNFVAEALVAVVLALGERWLCSRAWVLRFARRTLIGLGFI